MDEVVENCLFVYIQRIRIKTIFKPMGAEGTKRNGKGKKKRGNRSPVHRLPLYQASVTADQPSADCSLPRHGRLSPPRSSNEPYQNRFACCPCLADPTISCRSARESLANAYLRMDANCANIAQGWLLFRDRFPRENPSNERQSNPDDSRRPSLVSRMDLLSRQGEH